MCKETIGKDSFNGKGMVRWSDGGLAQGVWENGELKGPAKIIYRSEDYYEGEVQKGRRHGNGVLRYSNGATYRGNFIKDMRDGYG